MCSRVDLDVDKGRVADRSSGGHPVCRRCVYGEPLMPVQKELGGVMELSISCTLRRIAENVPALPHPGLCSHMQASSDNIAMPNLTTTTTTTNATVGGIVPRPGVVAYIDDWMQRGVALDPALFSMAVTDV